MVVSVRKWWCSVETPMPAIFARCSIRSGFASLALISQRGNRPKAPPLTSLEDSVDDLALNQATQKGNVLRGVQQVHEPTACIEQLRRGLAGGHRRTIRRRLRRLNLLSAQKLSDYGHFELE